MTPSEFSSSPTWRLSTWQQAYEAVLKETDTPALFKLVEMAAVLTRRSSVEGSANHHADRRAIEEAVAHLLVIKRDRLKFR